MSMRVVALCNQLTAGLIVSYLSVLVHAAAMASSRSTTREYALIFAEGA